MSFFDQIRDKLFPQENSGHKEVTLIHELLSRSSAFGKQYSHWKTKDKTNILQHIKEDYKRKSNGEDAQVFNIVLLNSSLSNGFAVHFNKRVSSKLEFQFLLEYFKEVMLRDGYKMANGDSKIIEKDGVMIATERYYLKPKTNFEDTIADQRYGNVMIELILHDDRPLYLKVMSNTYNDHKYTKAAPFAELFRKLVL